ncbi:MAG: hypothetical protein M1150_02315 [Patescibacteria group bacterium]|nr:hypothetical protein [Patescibacteria group bacterium]
MLKQLLDKEGRVTPASLNQFLETIQRQLWSAASIASRELETKSAAIEIFAAYRQAEHLISRAREQLRQPATGE